jgi:DNA-binding IscR family transcriptional regulator
MQIGTRFTVAIHILLCAEVFKDRYKVTSDFIAASARINAVNIRKIMGLLREAGFIEVAAGTGGIRLLKKPAKITLCDIFHAVEPITGGSLFRIHAAEPNCPVGGKIEPLLGGYLAGAQEALEKSLAKTTLWDLLEQIGDEG